MFQITDNKVFKDSVHGYISVPRCFVKNIIDTEMFQRLRNIDQTGMRVLYPDAKHDRFGHSLGVFHLGCKAVDALLENFSKDDYWAIQSDNKSELFWAKNKLLFMLACLLHDIGHTPFSHSLEGDVVDNSISKSDTNQFKRELAELICQKEGDKQERVDAASIKAAAHEQLGARYILEHFGQNIEAVYDALIHDEFPHVEKNGILFAEYYDGRVVLSKDRLDEDICFIVRMILGLKYTEYKPEKQIRNCFIELLNSSNFDVDKLDYILRDTQMSGIANINVDVERLLGAINIVTKTVYKRECSCNIQDGKIYELSTIKQDIEDSDELCNSEYWNKKVASCCLRLKGNFKGVIRLFKGTYVRIKENSSFEKLEGEDGDDRLVLYEPAVGFSGDTEASVDGELFETKADIVSVDYKNVKAHHFVIKNAYVKKQDFRFRVANEVISLYLNGECNVEISGECSIQGVLTTKGEATIQGRLGVLKLIGNYLQDTLPDKNRYNEFSVGYNRQAINIIANVLEARDYLYLWVYAHHKVVYYANYLIPILARNSIAKKNKSTWMLEYKDIEKLDDFYVWTEIKKASSNKTKGTPLYDELFSRKYKCSIYKSLSDFELIFRDFSDKEKKDIQNFFVGMLDDKYCLEDLQSIKSGGYLKANILGQIKQEAQKYNFDAIQGVKELVYVQAPYKVNSIDPHGTFIIMGNEVAVMEEIPLLSDRKLLTPQKTVHYFYLYYSIDSNDEKVIAKTTEQWKRFLPIFFADWLKCNEKNRQNHKE